MKTDKTKATLDDLKIGEKIGVVGVDSGQVMICDPCYIEGEWKEDPEVIHDYSELGKSPKWRGNFDQLVSEAKGRFSYHGCCNATLSESGAGQLNYQLGHAGVGVAVRTAFGDGCYAAYKVMRGDDYVGVIVMFDENDYPENRKG